MMDKLKDIKTFNLNKLRKINEFQPGWNGSDASAFSDELINIVRRRFLWEKD